MSDKPVMDNMQALRVLYTNVAMEGEIARLRLELEQARKWSKAWKKAAKMWREDDTSDPGLLYRNIRNS